jgi:hypothetical protein
MLFDIEERDLDIWESDGTISIAGILIMMSVGRYLSRVFNDLIDDFTKSDF